MSHLKYLRYLLRHKLFVAYVLLSTTYHEVAKKEWPKYVWAAVTHDLSKFRPSEWLPYAKSFFIDRNKYKKEFKNSFILHQARNPHHLGYWANNGTARPMPELRWREMLADWEGASMAQADSLKTWDRHTVLEWYESHKNNMNIHPHTKSQVEAYLSRRCGKRPS